MFPVLIVLCVSFVLASGFAVSLCGPQFLVHCDLVSTTFVRFQPECAIIAVLGVVSLDSVTVRVG